MGRIAPDESGNRYGRLIVVQRAEPTGTHHALWFCVCDCGNDKIANGGQLRSGKIRSCGCLYLDLWERKASDLKGNRFGRLVAILRCESKNGKTQWICQCDCGVVKNVPTHHLVEGAVRSCGCLQREGAAERMAISSYRHGMAETPLYKIWSSMIHRCGNPNNRAYFRYGGRGITVCDAWKSPQPFLLWALKNGYREGLTLDRIDNDKGYGPYNCRFTTWKVQGNNKSTNVIVEWHGERKTVAQWIGELGLPLGHSTICRRLLNGWTPDEAFNMPSHRGARPQHVSV